MIVIDYRRAQRAILIFLRDASSGISRAGLIPLHRRTVRFTKRPDVTSPHEGIRDGARGEGGGGGDVRRGERP